MIIKKCKTLFHEAAEQQNLFLAKRKQMYTAYSVFVKRLVFPKTRERERETGNPFTIKAFFSAPLIDTYP